MSGLKKFWDNFEGYCCVLALTAMSIVVFIQVVFRFVLKASLPWSEEVTRYLLVWTTFMGGAYGVRQGSHVGIEAFMLLFPKTVRKIVGILVTLCCLALSVVIVKFSWELTLSIMAKNQLSPAMRMPMGYAYMAVPVGMALFAVRYIQNIYLSIRDFNKEEEKPAEFDHGGTS